MHHAFKAFMNKILDYAGLFPPARLPMDEAVRNYLRYRNEPDEWMLSRFICPAVRLRELDKYRDNFRSFEKPLRFSILGRGGESINEFLTGLTSDIHSIQEFKEYQRGAVIVDAYEVKLPTELIDKSNPSLTTEVLNRVAESIESAIPDSLTAFYEGVSSANWEQTVEALIAGISEHNRATRQKGRGKYETAGYKLRCGGVDASAYPAPGQVAHGIHLCKQYQVPLKATAGLHHPLRHFNQADRVMMHGFLNLFGAGILAQHHPLSVGEIKNILEDEDARNFVFEGAEFRWKNLTVAAEQIQNARNRLVISFGSCSFDEPRQDLRSLGYL